MDLTGGWNSMRRRGQSPPWNEGRKGRRGERKDHRSRVQVNRANKRWKFGMNLAMKLNLLDWTRHSAGRINQHRIQGDQKRELIFDKHFQMKWNILKEDGQKRKFSAHSGMILHSDFVLCQLDLRNSFWRSLHCIILKPISSWIHQIFPPMSQQSDASGFSVSCSCRIFDAIIKNYDEIKPRGC